MRPIRVVLSALIGSDNLGDEAIAQMVIGRFEVDERFELTVLTRDRQRTAQMCSNLSTQITEVGLRALWRELRKSDCLVLGGGGIINDQSSVLSLGSYFLRVLVARIARRPVYLSWVGVGPLSTRPGRAILRLMGPMVRHSLVRDAESAEVLRRHGFAADSVSVAYDIAFSLPPPDARRIERPHAPYLLFCPRDWFFNKAASPTRKALEAARQDPTSPLHEFRNQLRSLVDRTLDEHPELTVLGVPFYPSQDSDLVDWIGGQLKAHTQSRYIAETNCLSPDEYLDLASGAAAVVGVRFHSLVLGAVARRPLVVLSYSDKVASFARYLGLNRRTVSLEAPRFDLECTALAIADALDEQEGEYATRLDDIHAVNEQAFAAILDRIAAGD